jgi:solute carrier family 25 (mitochondrial carnitine/acylcarnitine transporter), member 20/29
MYFFSSAAFPFRAIAKRRFFYMFLGSFFRMGRLTSPLVLPIRFDTVKTKMQAEPAYMNGGMTATFKNVVKNEGFLALYKGLMPPLIGSSIFRSVQFGVYSWCQTLQKDIDFMRKEIPLTLGLEPRVVVSGVVASTARAIVETPLELIKVRMQVGQQWGWSGLMHGFGVTWIRTTGLMTTFFVLCDTFERNAPVLMHTPIVGPFLKGGVAATIGWWIIWPFENLKSQIQGNTPGPKKLWDRFFWTFANGGVRSLFRGFVPGTGRSIVANGASMLAFEWCQDLREKYLSKNKK